MARLNPCYGSELHLLRMLGRHRRFFDQAVRDITGADEIEWFDFPSGDMRVDKHGHAMWDREWQHLEFLTDDAPAKSAWDTAWPTHRPGHNWDAIGRLHFGAAREWVLVEAKANLQELASDCHAEDPWTRKAICQTLDATKAALGAPESCDWSKHYYQFCNRLAVLHAMNGAGSAARMLFVYFFGDVGDGGRTCPASKAEWADELAKQDRHVGLPADHPLKDRTHRLFVDARCIVRA
jgi:hypothetical protein